MKLYGAGMILFGVTTIASTISAILGCVTALKIIASGCVLLAGVIAIAGGLSAISK